VIDQIDGLNNDVELAEWLMESAGVSTVPGSAFGAPGHLRLSYAASLEYLEEAVRRIDKAVRSRGVVG